MALEAKGTVERLKSVFSDAGGGDVVASSSDVLSGRQRLLSPLEIHFSQSHIRPDFQDGLSVLETATAMQAPEHRQKFDKLQIGEANEWEAVGVPVGDGHWWLLQPPFPGIEVIQWRCKIRAEDGSLKVDEQGCELYGEREWYSLDNRRLYCLQRAAAALHPIEVRCVVSVIRQEEGNCREFRKFRTPDRGRTVALGHRDALDLPRWSWRRDLGLPDEVLSCGSTIAKPRRRGPNSGRGQAQSGGRRGASDDEEGSSGGMREFAMNASIFILVYVALRLSFYVANQLYGAVDVQTALSGATGTEGAVSGGR